MRASTPQVVADQLFGEIRRAAIGVVHHNHIGELEEGVEGEEVVDRVLGVACDDADDNRVAGVEAEDLLGEDAGIGAADDEDLDRVEHLGKGW